MKRFSQNKWQVVGRTASFMILMIYSIISLLPLVWTLISSIKTNTEILTSPIALPKEPVFSNYPNAWIMADMGMYFKNTIFYVVVSVAVIVIISAMASYILARVKQNMILSTYFTLGIMVPVHTIFLPIFLIVRNLGILNTRLSIILIFIATNLAMSVFILTGFMKSFPREVEEAALIDGCTRSKSFFKIVFPLSKPGLATIATLAFLNCWNDLLMPLILITDTKLKVLTVAIQDLRGQYTQDYGLICTGIVLSTLPVVMMYIFLQESFVAGLTAGAVKG